MEGVQTVNRWRTLAFTSLGHLINDGWTNFIPLIADILVNERGASLSIVTLTSVSFYSSSALFNFIVGHMASRQKSQGTLLALGIAIISLSFVGFDSTLSYAPQSALYALVAVFAITAGFGSAFYHPISASVLMSTFSFNNRGKAMGVNGAFGAVGAAVFPPLFFGIAVFVSQRDALTVLTFIGMGAALGILFGLHGYHGPREATGERPKPMRDALTKAIVLLGAITALRSVANTGVSVWIPEYITFVRGEGVGPTLGLSLSLLYVGGIPGQIVFGALVERLDKRYVLGFSSAGSGLAVLGYIATSGDLSLVFIALFGVFSYSSFPTLLSLVSDYVPSSSWTTANGFVWGIGIQGGNIIGPALTQLIIGNSDARLNIAFLVLAIVGVAGGLVTPLMKKGEFAGKNAGKRKTE